MAELFDLQCGTTNWRERAIKNDRMRLTFAQQSDTLVRRSNANIAQYPRSLGTPLRQYRQVRSDELGPGFDVTDYAHDVAPVRVGDEFPATYDALRAMTRRELHAFSRLLHDSFGIEPKHSLATCRRKLEFYLLSQI